MKNNVVYIGILVIFVFYWFSTLLYCTPTNFIRIELNNYIQGFEKLFYQRWTFFTPPPKINERIFFQYINEDDSTDRYTVEVLKEINIRRRESPVFNVSHEVLEDIILYNAYGLNNSLSMYYKLLKTSFPDSSESYLTAQMVNYISLPTSQPVFFKTLRNYARIVHKRHNLTNDYNKFKIVLTSVSIVPFKYRYDTNYKSEESILFETPLTEL